MLSRSANLKRIISEDVDNAGAVLSKAHIKCMDFQEEGDLAEVLSKAIAINAQHYDYANEKITTWTSPD